MCRCKVLWIGMSLLFMVAGSVNARSYYVSTEGNDKQAGTLEAPFQTIHKACSLAQAGDTVVLQGGVYKVTEPIRPVHSGKSDAWIVYQSMPGEEAIIDGSLLKTVKQDKMEVPFSSKEEGVVQIEYVAYIKWIGITVRNSYAAGFLLCGGDHHTFSASRDSPTHHIILEGCVSDRSYNSGIGLWYADSIRVTRCRVTAANDLDYRTEGVRRPGEAPHEAISVCGSRYFEIDHNVVHDCFKEGIDCKEVSRYGKVHHNMVQRLPRQAYYVDAWFGLLEDIELYENVAIDCFWGFAISVEGENSELRNIRFHHNVIANMQASGFLFGMWGGNHLRSNIHIYNNTFYRCGSPHVYCGGVGSIDILSQNFKDVFIYRNICDKGWDYEFGFNEKAGTIPNSLKEKNFVAKENLVESVKNRQSRPGQFNAVLVEYLPEGNHLGNVLYRDEKNYDLTPEKAPKVKGERVQWKYAPSDWYGAIKPIEQY